VVFSVTAGGTTPLTYQWHFNGKPITGENSAALILNHVDVPNGGQYHVAVWNGAGFAISQTAALTINIPPNIFSHPVAQVVNSNAPASFAVSAAGTGTLRYQWQLNGMNLENATNMTLTINNAQPSDEGLYRVLVTDDITTVMSAEARLIVRWGPSIEIPPQGQTNVVGSTMTFSVRARGSVRWDSNGAKGPRR
jgi:hypothetical protein